MRFTALLVLVALLVVVTFAQVRSTAYTQDLTGYAFINSEVGFIRTSDSKIWRSGDGGMTWVDQSSIMKHTDHTVRFLALNPADENRVWFTGSEGVAWRSRDGGLTYEFVNKTPSLVELHWHPEVADWGLGVTFSDGCRNQGSCYRVMWLTQDWGSTWKPIIDYVYTFTWSQRGEGGDADERSVLRDDGSSPDVEVTRQAILAVVARDRSGSQSNKGYDQFDLVYSQDFFATDPVLILSNCYWMEEGDAFWVAYRTTDDAQTELWVAEQPYYSFKKALFPPYTKIRGTNFNVLQEFSDSIWLAVDPASQVKSWTDVYQSGSDGAKYVRVLRHVSKKGRTIEFDQVGALEGFYLANIVDGLSDDDSQNTQDLPDMKIKTVFTFNNGGGKTSWKLLTPPQVDSKKQPISCVAPNCSLHLHGTWDRNSRWGPFYSTDNAVGLIIANGNVGPYLDFETVNTYFSRDGGFTWEEIMKGPSIYEFGDHGSITILAQTATKTNTIMYSLDEGMNWYTYTMPLPPFYVQNIMTEPSNTGEKFVVYGLNNGKRNWVGLDFSGALTRVCDSTDYESWQPLEGYLDGQNCMLGHIRTYTRRKRNAYCWDNEEQREDSVVNCACTDDDYECDYGYEEDETGACVLLNPPPSDDMMQPAYCPLGSVYNSTDGYRQVPGDTCVNGVQHVGPPKKCVAVNLSPSAKKPASLGFIIGFGLVLPVSLLAGFFAIRYSKAVRSKFTCVKWPSSWDRDEGAGRGRAYTSLQQQGLQLDEVVEDDPDEIHDDSLHHGDHDHHDDLNVRALAADDSHPARPSTSEARASIFGDPDAKIVINLPPSAIENTSATAKSQVQVEVVTTIATSTEPSTTNAVGDAPATHQTEALLDSTA